MSDKPRTVEEIARKLWLHQDQLDLVEIEDALREAVAHERKTLREVVAAKKCHGMCSHGDCRGVRSVLVAFDAREAREGKE